MRRQRDATLKIILDDLTKHGQILKPDALPLGHLGDLAQTQIA